MYAPNITHRTADFYSEVVEKTERPNDWKSDSVTDFIRAICDLRGENIFGDGFSDKLY